MSKLREDLQASWRLLVKHPWVNTIAIGSLALGIGANTAIFSFVNAFLLRPPAVADAARLTEVWGRNPRRGGPMNGYMPLTYPDYACFRDHNHSFSGLAAFQGEPYSVVWNRDGQGEVLQVQFATSNYFSVLGIHPVLGRGFLPSEEDAHSADRSIVLSYAFWKTRLNRDAGIVGKSLVINGRHLTVAGVAPENFRGMLVVLSPDFWAAPAAMAAIEPGWADQLSNHNAYWLFAIGRMRAGVAGSHVQAELNVLTTQVAATHSKDLQNLRAEGFPVQLTPAPVRGYIAAFAGGAMLLVLLVLLIACANAANLLLAQAIERRREMSVRLALGANRVRLMRSMLTHSLLLAALAGSLGLLLAYRAAPLLLLLKPSSFPAFVDVSTDWRVLSWTLALSMTTGVLFGLAPALRATRVDISDDLKDGAQMGGTARSRLRDVLVVAQVAACIVMLIGSGLALHSLYNARSIEPGFNPNGVLAGRIDPGAARYGEEQGRATYREVLDRVHAMPGVASTSMVDRLPLSASLMIRNVSIDGQPVPGGVQTYIATPEYFKTMQTPLLAGREFAWQDGQKAPHVVIINEAMARHFWPGQNAIGKQVTIMLEDAKRVPAEVAGIVATGKYQDLSEPAKPVMFLPLSQSYVSRVVLLVRDAHNRPLDLLPQLRRQLHSMDINLALIEPETLNQAMELPLFMANLAGTLFTAFGTLALALALIGLYGVIAFSVSQRTREIGVRMALGAAPKDVLALVIGQGARLALIGAAIGLPIAFLAAGGLGNVLYGISSSDPITFVGVPLLLIGLAALASYIPAVRAARLNPLSALRHE